MSALAPWLVPVPVRSADFVSLYPEHAALSVITDLAAIGSFGRANVADDSLAYADLQLPPEYPLPGRGGSARSVFFRGSYLKGVGRTPLSWNWTDTDDVYHSSGHLLPSAALRELIASWIAEASGIADTIVPCTGLLLRRADPDLQEALQSTPEFGEFLSPIDRVLQAITVKPAGFVRWSNVLWQVEHALPSIESFIEIVEALSSADRARSARPSDGNLSARALADIIARRVESGFEAFAAYFRAGIYWGSFSNNMTLGGQFLDLEVPIFFGEPFVGVVPVMPGRRPPTQEHAAESPLIGVETLYYVAQTRAALARLVPGLARLAARSGSDAAVTFAKQLEEALHEALPPEHLLWNDGALRERLLVLLGESKYAPAELGTWLDGAIAENLGGAPRRPVDVCQQTVELANPEPMCSISCWTARTAPGVSSQGCAAERRTLVYDVFEQLVRITDPDRVLAELAGVREKIFESFRAQT